MAISTKTYSVDSVDLSTADDDLLREVTAFPNATAAESGLAEGSARSHRERRLERADARDQHASRVQAGVGRLDLGDRHR